MNALIRRLPLLSVIVGATLIGASRWIQYAALGQHQTEAAAMFYGNHFELVLRFAAFAFWAGIVLLSAGVALCFQKLMVRAERREAAGRTGQP